MDMDVPKHHMKGDVCATRPVYREGRIPKAVKVYTVNNESQYILIQNVPSVGAKDELLKLCSNFGSVEEHHNLDEYPTEDKYTEVHLIKYTKINSARFAKRKLDDHSFFGGTLHVCYAPEYESVVETRAKLLERRRTVASKMRQHYGDTQRDFHQRRSKEYFDAERNSSDLVQTPQETTPAMINNVLLQPVMPLEANHKFVSNLLDTSSTDNPVSSINSPQAEESSSFSRERNAPESESHIPFVTFDIPLPPKPSPHNIQRNVNYEFARVRSHHASLPPGFSTMNDELVKSFHKDKDLKSIKPHTDDSASSRKDQVIGLTNHQEQSPVIIRDYTMSKPALKFVPRQTIKRGAIEAGHSKVDSQNTAIKKSAFLLGDVQGPSDIPGRRAERPKLDPGVEKSVQNSISAIRSKISKVISDNVKPR